MKELRVKCGIVPHGRETQSIHVLFGDREIVVIARLVDECKDAVGNADGIENQKETASFKQNPFHVRFAS